MHVLDRHNRMGNQIVKDLKVSRSMPIKGGYAYHQKSHEIDKNSASALETWHQKQMENPHMPLFHVQRIVQSTRTILLPKGHQVSKRMAVSLKERGFSFQLTNWWWKDDEKQLAKGVADCAEGQPHFPDSSRLRLSYFLSHYVMMGRYTEKAVAAKLQEWSNDSNLYREALGDEITSSSIEPLHQQ